MVFFLHVPRTAGRTYHSCFLKLGSPPSARCEKSYDVLRLNASLTGCSLLGSHDDFSIRQHLPEDTAVVTQLRCHSHCDDVTTVAKVHAHQYLFCAHSC